VALADAGKTGLFITNITEDAVRAKGGTSVETFKSCFGYTRRINLGKTECSSCPQTLRQTRKVAEREGFEPPTPGNITGSLTVHLFYYE
jgi:hypothetical protein